MEQIEHGEPSEIKEPIDGLMLQERNYQKK